MKPNKKTEVKILKAIKGSNAYLYMLDIIIVGITKRLSNPNIQIQDKDIKCGELLSCINQIKARIEDIDASDILLSDMTPTVIRISQLISTTISFYNKTNPSDKIYIIAIINELDSILELIDKKINPRDEAPKVNQLILPKQIQA